MATAAQITANRQNAQFSTGPRTEAGKQLVSANARTHGLAAKKFFLSPEDKPLFDQMREAFLEHYQPATAHERNLVEELAEAKWRCRTAQTMETAFFEAVITEQQKAEPSLTTDQALARVFIDNILQKRMRLMMRYLTAAGSSAEKARRELERVIAIRRAEEAAQAELRAMMAMRAPAPAAAAPPPPPADSANRVCSALPQKC